MPHLKKGSTILKTAHLTLATLLLGSVSYAAPLKLYTDPSTGQIYSQAGEDRVLLGEFVKSEADSTKNLTSLIDTKSPQFLLGQQTGPNMKITAQDDKNMYLKLGVRFQGTFEQREEDFTGSTNDISNSDAYMRRVRFEATAGFSKYLSFTMDIRNDKANYEDDGEKGFNVGDAYLKIKKPFDTSLVNFKLYRGKIDVSRTETVKSAYTVHYDRASIADEAAQYITHNRRGSNIQMYGDWNKKIHYQVAVGDGVYSGKMKDARGSSFGGDVESQDYFYGGKLKLSPFDGWEEKQLTETYFAKGKHFTVGAAYWKTGNIQTDAPIGTIDHELLNLEISAHYKGLSMSAEYFAFDGVVKDWSATEIGKSDGWYALAEYVFEDYGYIAPFIRYESWDKYEDKTAGEDYDFTSTIAGVNWYLRGNTIKAGFVVQEDEYGASLKNGPYTDTRYKITTQWFF